MIDQLVPLVDTAANRREPPMVESQWKVPTTEDPMNEHAHHDQQHAQHRHAAPPDYQTWVTAQRDGKDDFFRHAPDSPIPPTERDSFAGLGYYPIDRAMRFESLSLGPVPEGLKEKLRVQTSDGAERHGRRVGTLGFSVSGVVQRLVALQLAGARDDSVFVPFKDATNGAETYGAGRYLDLRAQDDGTYDLDFNLAYAPFCAYSPSYSCPLPPRENWLSARIEAGERNT